MINIIVAYDLNKCIGKNGKIPWKIKGEQSQFKELTSGNIIIMGRKTYEEIGKPLVNRRNIVITRNQSWDKTEHYESLEKAVSACLETSYKDIYIIGGASIYKEAIDKIPIDNYYITVINKSIKNGDTFFPNFDRSLYECKTIEIQKEYIRYIYTKKENKI